MGKCEFCKSNVRRCCATALQKDLTNSPDEPNREPKPKRKRVERIPLKELKLLIGIADAATKSNSSIPRPSDIERAIVKCRKIFKLK